MGCFQVIMRHVGMLTSVKTWTFSGGFGFTTKQTQKRLLKSCIHTECKMHAFLIHKPNSYQNRKNRFEVLLTARTPEHSSLQPTLVKAYELEKFPG